MRRGFTLSTFKEPVKVLGVPGPRRSAPADVFVPRDGKTLCALISESRGS
jgi:hypothetical protein